jgi:sec-independent protein translocase protein TatA
LLAVDVGPAELLIVLLVVLVVFGGAKIPELARSLGKAKREFAEGMREGASSDDDPSTPPSS